jgi:hypothetical protein
MFAVPALLVTWTLFCTVRFVQLRFGGAHRGDAISYNRESYGFALGGVGVFNCFAGRHCHTEPVRLNPRLHLPPTVPLVDVVERDTGRQKSSEKAL